MNKADQLTGDFIQKIKVKKQGYYGELGARFVSWLYILGTYEKYYSSISGWSYPYVRLEGVCTAKFIPVFSEVGIGFEQQLDKDHNYLTLKSPFQYCFFKISFRFKWRGWFKFHYSSDL